MTDAPLQSSLFDLTLSRGVYHDHGRKTQMTAKYEFPSIDLQIQHNPGFCFLLFLFLSLPFLPPPHFLTSSFFLSFVKVDTLLLKHIDTEKGSRPRERVLKKI